MDSNTKAFLNEAVPANANAHVLAIAEFHNAKEHFAYLRQHLDELKNEHNVQTIGAELAPMMNVLFWAYKDGNLPVEKGKERAYVRTMMQAYSNSRFPEQAAARADLLMDAADKGIAVVAFDGRELLEERAASGRIALAVLQRHPEIATAIHTSPDRSSMRQGLEGAVNDFKVNIAKNAPFSEEKTERLAWELGSFAVMTEIKQLAQAHPEYMQRLLAIENRSTSLRRQGKVGDEVSAVLLADAVGGTNGNVLTTYGLTHLAGRSVPVAHTNGRLGELLSETGLKVTTVAVLGQTEFPSVMAPIEADKGAFAPAVSVQPMNLLAVGAEGQADILIRNLHQGISAEDAGASDVGKYVASHSRFFASTQKDVDSSRQGVLRDAKTYLAQIIRNDFPEGSGLLATIDAFAANDKATHADALQVMNATTRYLEMAPRGSEKKRHEVTTRQLAGFLRNYLDPETQGWQTGVTAAASGAVAPAAGSGAKI